MNAQAVAALLGNEKVHGDSVQVKGVCLDRPVTVMNARLERLELHEVLCRGDLTITGCRIDTLEIANLELARGAAFALHDCVVDTIELRSFSGRGATSIERVRAATIVAHGIRCVSMLACATDDGVTLSRVSGALTLCDIACGELLIRDLDDDDLSVEITDVSCRRELEVHSGSIQTIAMAGTRAEAILIRRLVAHTAQPAVLLSACGVAGDLTVGALTNTKGPAIRIDGVRLSGSLVIGRIEVPPDASTIAQLTDSFIAGDMRLDVQALDAPPCQINDTTIGGSLRLAALDAPLDRQRRGLVDLQAGSVTDMTLPAERLRTGADVERLAIRLYGAPTVDGLAALRAALAAQHRPNDEDAVYAVLQDRTASRVRRAALGGVFGWGVRLVPPARMLALLVLATAIVVFVAASGHGSLPERSLTACLRALGLWANVDVKLAHEPTSDAYGVVRVFAGAGGIVFATVLVGIVIRKLVR